MGKVAQQKLQSSSDAALSSFVVWMVAMLMMMTVMTMPFIRQTHNFGIPPQCRSGSSSNLLVSTTIVRVVVLNGQRNRKGVNHYTRPYDFECHCDDPIISQKYALYTYILNHRLVSWCWFRTLATDTSPTWFVPRLKDGGKRIHYVKNYDIVGVSMVMEHRCVSLGLMWTIFTCCNDIECKFVATRITRDLFAIKFVVWNQRDRKQIFTYRGIYASMPILTQYSSLHQRLTYPPTGIV
jgi:hypothetical protein